MSFEALRSRRKTVAVVFADVVGYARMTDADETDAHRRLMYYRKAVVFPAILRFKGRVLQTRGDGFLAEFSSAADGAQCACEIQRAINSHEPPNAGPGRFQLRIGLNFGEVIVEEDMIYGEIVNVAARVEALAAPGAVWITDAVEKELRKIPYFECEYLGSFALKNILAPARLYRLTASDTPSDIDLDDLPGPGLSTIGVPSVVVLPLAVDSTDPVQAALAQSVAHSVAARLASWRWFRVFSPEVSTAHVPLGRDPIRAARAFDARYVLTGTLRADPPRLRVSVELVDGITGYQIWTQQFDQTAKSITVVEDCVVAKVGALVDAALHQSERNRAISKLPDQIDAHDLVQRGYWHYAHRTPRYNARARRLFTDALDRDPNLAFAATGKAAALFWAGQMRWARDPEAALQQGLRFASDAVLADDRLPMAHLLLGQNLLFLGQQDAAINAARHAIDLNQSYAGAWAFLGHALTATGHFRAAIRAIRMAFQLTSHDSRRFMWLSNLAIAYFHIGDVDRALKAAQEAKHLHSGHWLSNQVLIATFGALGRTDEAKALIQSVRTDEPDMELSTFANRLPYRRASDRDRIIDGLRRAGWDD